VAQPELALDANVVRMLPKLCILETHRDAWENKLWCRHPLRCSSTTLSATKSLSEDGEADENIDPQSKYLWKSHLRIIPAAIFFNVAGYDGELLRTTSQGSRSRSASSISDRQVTKERQDASRRRIHLSESWWPNLNDDDALPKRVTQQSERAKELRAQANSTKAERKPAAAHAIMRKIAQIHHHRPEES
jgi:hypothetical protein